MTGFWDLMLSPAGIALYAGFWAVKLAAGAWIASRLVAFLPLRAQVRAAVWLGRFGVRVKGPLQ